jgi:hypothetical protein
MSLVVSHLPFSASLFASAAATMSLTSQFALTYLPLKWSASFCVASQTLNPPGSSGVSLQQARKVASESRIRETRRLIHARMPQLVLWRRDVARELCQDGARVERDRADAAMRILGVDELDEPVERREARLEGGEPGRGALRADRRGVQDRERARVGGVRGQCAVLLEGEVRREEDAHESDLPDAPPLDWRDLVEWGRLFGVACTGLATGTSRKGRIGSKGAPALFTRTSSVMLRAASSSKRPLTASSETMSMACVMTSTLWCCSRISARTSSSSEAVLDVMIRVEAPASANAIEIPCPNCKARK